MIIGLNIFSFVPFAAPIPADIIVPVERKTWTEVCPKVNQWVELPLNDATIRRCEDAN